VLSFVLLLLLTRKRSVEGIICPVAVVCTVNDILSLRCLDLDFDLSRSREVIGHVNIRLVICTILYMLSLL